MSNIPPTLKYTASHEWIQIEGDVATIGISDHAQSELGDVVYVDLPKVGRALKAEETFGSVESVKTVSDLYSPLTGIVLEINEKLTSNSELINSNPYDEGFLIKLKIGNTEEVSKLLDATQYQEIVG